MKGIAVGTVVESLIDPTYRPLGMRGLVTGGPRGDVHPILQITWADRRDSYEYVEDEGQDFRVILL
jgi:hypothetical protein